MIRRIEFDNPQDTRVFRTSGDGTAAARRETDWARNGIDNICASVIYHGELRSGLGCCRSYVVRYVVNPKVFSLPLAPAASVVPLKEVMTPRVLVNLGVAVE